MTDTNKERAEFEAWIRTQPGYTDAVLGRRDSPGSARVGEYVKKPSDAIQKEASNAG